MFVLVDLVVREYLELKVDLIIGKFFVFDGDELGFFEFFIQDDFGEQDGVFDEVYVVVGFYFYYYILIDNGLMYIYCIVVKDINVFVVICMSDGGDYWFEVYFSMGKMFGVVRVVLGYVYWQMVKEVWGKMFFGEF